jgi:hypothetical protein
LAVASQFPGYTAGTKTQTSKVYRWEWLPLVLEVSLFDHGTGHDQKNHILQRQAFQAQEAGRKVQWTDYLVRALLGIEDDHRAVALVRCMRSAGAEDSVEGQVLASRGRSWNGLEGDMLEMGRIAVEGVPIHLALFEGAAPSVFDSVKKI